MNPLISIAIPTHNRAKYAIHSILSILAITDGNFEIVVSDTSTDGELFERLKKDPKNPLMDRRLRYVQPTNKLDMTGNHNAAIEATTGDYVCLIGDDDTISKDAILAAAWAKDNAIDIISPNVTANYVWPDFRSRLMGTRHAARLYLAKNFEDISFKNSNDALNKAMQNAAQGTDGLPKIYHGIVKRSILEDIKNSSGAFFHGSSPDVSGAIALAAFSKNYIVIDYPLTIPGASGGSNTGRSAMNTHKGKLSQESQTRKFENNGWTLGVPKFFSVETVWAHAALETLRKIAPDNINKFNFARLIAITKVLHPEYMDEINQAMKEIEIITKLTKNELAYLVKNEIKKYQLQRLKRLIKRIAIPTAAGGRKYITGLETIESAPAELAKHLADINLDWEKVAHHIKCSNTDYGH